MLDSKNINYNNKQKKQKNINAIKRNKKALQCRITDKMITRKIDKIFFVTIATTKIGIESKKKAKIRCCF